jgi:formate-dependent nitrite reductase membrane component NrfD
LLLFTLGVVFLAGFLWLCGALFLRQRAHVDAVVWVLRFGLLLLASAMLYLGAFLLVNSWGEPAAIGESALGDAAAVSLLWAFVIVGLASSLWLLAGALTSAWSGRRKLH